MKTIAIASGKGGVGKTNIATNLAIALAHDEKKVLVVDADLGLSNVDVLLAISPQSTMKDVVSGDVQAGQAVTATEYDIDVISGGTGAKELVDLDQESLDGLWKQVNKLTEQYDHVVIDTASGIGRSVMTFLKKADRVLVVCTPDPTSMMDAYATTKLLFDENPQADVALLVNMADNVRQGLVVFERYKAIVGQFLNREISLAGVIVRDATVLNCTLSREPFMAVSPGCHAAKQLADIAETVVRRPEAKEDDDEHGETMGLLERVHSAFAFLKGSGNDEDEEDDEVEAKAA